MARSLPDLFNILKLAVADTNSMIRLGDLHLDDARALLEHEPSSKLPDPATSPAAFVQGIVDGLCVISMRDPLTGLANRRNFMKLIEQEIESVVRSGEPALLLMLDIDHFKKINDTHGHRAGDQVLQAVAGCLTSCVRPMDTVARYGGEEFALILPDCGASYGPIVAERIRKAVEEMVVPISLQTNLKVTISIGGAYAPEWVRSVSSLWIERADEQLYFAKGAGRNCVFIETQRDVAVSAEEKGMLFGHLLAGDPDGQ